MTVAAIALGSNLGDREGALREAVQRVSEFGTVTAVSRFYDTAPVGYLDQPRFLNGAMLLSTELPARELMRGLLAIEGDMGRKRVIAKGPRVIDLDLLLFGEEVIASERLVVPHPSMGERRFVLEPLAEIAASMVHPVSGLTVEEMMALVE
ncbi:2-amino-4-hydroxy-6-hydroxymethyldihydropteridine diphosphokinase [Granulicella sibirica]|uniref:2-amino-4-hydroxy-6-hydroxymethyldihydropteridine pyrophosphokinase n=1 Tax=Granulicella sibirica TaxID=2479048 RepID=A0A4Q0TAA6_9BACT|nr:2-amino-4-hydroxy-6-hydroxymethyldihydropteridine diphosphokinase [Granulicella sibirica]RXH58571.1 2-amino-4-hydroxy-6-hydroxymethyldihydropteridine pyrophosphokinase [Granulicella sibirica]